MIVIPPPKYRKRREPLKRNPSAPPSPPVGLTLVSATYDPLGPSVTLTFDRGINIDNLTGSLITVIDSVDLMIAMEGIAIEMLDGPTLRMLLGEDGPSSGSGVRLSAPSAVGIVASDDGAEWAGVNDLVLPWP